MRSLFVLTGYPGKFPGNLLLMTGLGLLLSAAGCPKDDPLQRPVGSSDERAEDLKKGIDYFLPDIDLSHWKVTLPVGEPMEVSPPEILNYATNSTLAPYMYNDSTDGSIVFYTFPASSTPNSSYSRTELREQMEPGSNHKNWTFPEGGRLKGTLAVAEISRDAEGKYHRTIIMQIHGRLTNEQRDKIGEDDNNAPPMLKIYWVNGKIRVKTKELRNVDASDEEILSVEAWTDDGGTWFDEQVGFEKFTLEIIASEGKMEVILNDKQSLVYENAHIDRWSIFENYFKAGNYLVTRDKGAFARVKYYALKVSHPK